MKTRWSVLLLALILLVPSQEGRSEQSEHNLLDSFRSAGSSVAGFFTGPRDRSDVLLVGGQEALAPGGCDPYDCTGCDVGDCGVGCVDACYVPRWRVFGEFLFLRPGNEKVAYAVPINGAIVPPGGAAPIQIGLEAVVDCGFNPGARIGFSYFMDECSDLVVTYTHFESDVSDQISIDPPYVIRSLVDHPGTWAAPTDFLTANARLDVDFQLVDLDYRRVLACGDMYAVHYLAGARYAHLDQAFGSVFTNATTIETVASEVSFDGGGIRVGLEGERYLRMWGLMVYGRTAASFLGGNFRGRYAQADNARGLVVNTGWNEDRVVSILDLELGLGWTGCGGQYRVTAGYLFSGWLNTMIMDEFIDGVRNNDSVSVADTLSFDGLAVRAEFRY